MVRLRLRLRRRRRLRVRVRDKVRVPGLAFKTSLRVRALNTGAPSELSPPSGLPSSAGLELPEDTPLVNW